MSTVSPDDSCALQAMGKVCFYMGPMGAGAVTKLAFNLMVGAQFHSLAEAMVLAAKGGVEPRRLGEVQTGTATGAIHETFTAARSRGHGEQDSSSVHCLLAELAGLQKPKP